MLRRFVTLALVLVTIGMTIISCSDKTTDTTPGNTPSIPPEYSMAMNFSNFEGQYDVDQATTEASKNFGQAAFRAGLFKSIVDINLAIPRALLRAASEADVQLNENKDWEWEFNTTAESNEYEVRLTAARDQAGDASWNFYVTNPQFGLEDKLFFSGVSYEQDTKGSWSYFSLLDSDGKEEKVSQITWTAENEDDLNLRLDVVSNRNDNEGDYLDYTLEGNIKTAVYFDASKGQETTIKWNTETNAGYIIAPDYNEGNKACWDDNFEDTSCPE